MLKQFSLLLLFIVFIFTAFSQSATLKGKVIDANNNPVIGASIIVKNKTGLGNSTNEFGRFTLRVPANKKLILEISSLNFNTILRTDSLEKGEVKNVVYRLRENTFTVDTSTVIGIKKNYRQEEQMLDIDVKEGAIPTTTGDISSFLEGQAFIQKNNELSTAYSVRGGNFDENLVYVNGFEIYRPFLIRSGQQEGLSFINPDMVDKIAFSAGGFQSKYGDKMASVLDVEYKRPIKFGGTVSASLLGANVEVEGTDKSRNFTFALGARYKTSRLLLGALDVNGQYQPTFVDLQGFLHSTLVKDFI